MPSRLESYVEELRQELRDLPVTHRAEQLAEVRTHLDTLKSANLELGLTEEEAEAAAIAQLGRPQQTTRVEKRTFWKTWCQGPFFAAHVFLSVGCLVFMLGVTTLRGSAGTQMMTYAPIALPLFLLGWIMALLVGKRHALLAIPLAATAPLIVMYSFTLLMLMNNNGRNQAPWFWPLAIVGSSAVPIFLGALLSFRLPSRRRRLA